MADLLLLVSHAGDRRAQERRRASPAGRRVRLLGEPRCAWSSTARTARAPSPRADFERHLGYRMSFAHPERPGAVVRSLTRGEPRGHAQRRSQAARAIERLARTVIERPGLGPVSRRVRPRRGLLRAAVIPRAALPHSRSRSLDARSQGGASDEPGRYLERLSGGRSTGAGAASRGPERRAPGRAAAPSGRNDLTQLKARIQRQLIAELAPEADLDTRPGPPRRSRSCSTSWSKRKGIPLPAPGAHPPARSGHRRGARVRADRAAAARPRRSLRSWSTGPTRSGSSATAS